MHVQPKLPQKVVKAKEKAKAKVMAIGNTHQPMEKAKVKDMKIGNPFLPMGKVEEKAKAIHRHLAYPKVLLQRRHLPKIHGQCAQEIDANIAETMESLTTTISMTAERE